MPRSVAIHQQKITPFRIGALALFAAALVAAAAATGVLAQNRASKRVVGEAQSSTLGKTVLTTTKRRTLYSLSVEKNGRFICTGSCLSVWHPLVVPAGVKPTGPVKLGTIVRPEGGTQVTYRGRPLYRFGGDAKAGDANGEGIKDVGTWHAAAVPQASSNQDPPAQSTPPADPAPPPSESPPPYQPPYSGY